jgi:hypothetical protein
MRFHLSSFCFLILKRKMRIYFLFLISFNYETSFGLSVNSWILLFVFQLRDQDLFY